jgi:hypothetical protein
MTLLHRFKIAGIAAGFFLALAALTNCASAADDTIIIDTTKAPTHQYTHKVFTPKVVPHVITPKASAPETVAPKSVAPKAITPKTTKKAITPRTDTPAIKDGKAQKAVAPSDVQLVIPSAPTASDKMLLHQLNEGNKNTIDQFHFDGVHKRIVPFGVYQHPRGGKCIDDP